MNPISKTAYEQPRGAIVCALHESKRRKRVPPLQCRRERHGLQHPPKRKPPTAKTNQLGAFPIYEVEKWVILPAIYSMYQHTVEAHGFRSMLAQDKYLRLVSQLREKFPHPVNIVAYTASARKLGRVLGC